MKIYTVKLEIEVTATANNKKQAVRIAHKLLSEADILTYEVVEFDNTADEFTTITIPNN